GKVHLSDTFDARFGVRFGRFTIDDFHGKHRILSVPEIYKYSSNIGTIHVMQALGKDNFRDFMTKIGFDQVVPFELPEMRMPKVPAKFSDIVAATASFGHGISISPLHMARAYAGFVNNGVMVPMTLMKRTPEEAAKLGQQIISPETSREIRSLMRLNALEGSGTRMNMYANGYRVGGKTGTAEKVIKGRYATGTNLNVFASGFPLDKPEYVMVIVVDEPKRESPTTGTTAGWNAGEVTGRIVARVAPMLGISPDFSQVLDDELVPPSIR
ncbi:MAG: penicillin-binding protein 2, partial [Rhizobiaceae bacterium]